MNRGCSGLRCRKFIEDDIGAFDADGVDFIVVDRRIFCDICILDAGGRVRSRQIIIDQIRPVGLGMDVAAENTGNGDRTVGPDAISAHHIPVHGGSIVVLGLEIVVVRNQAAGEIIVDLHTADPESRSIRGVVRTRIDVRRRRIVGMVAEGDHGQLARGLENGAHIADDRHRPGAANAERAHILRPGNDRIVEFSPTRIECSSNVRRYNGLSLRGNLIHPAELAGTGHRRKVKLTGTLEINRRSGSLDVMSIYAQIVVLTIINDTPVSRIAQRHPAAVTHMNRCIIRFRIIGCIIAVTIPGITVIPARTIIVIRRIEENEISHRLNPTGRWTRD